MSGFLDEIRIYDCGVTKIRIGSDHDGGYVVASEACEKVDAVYSYGVGNDVSFELDLVTKFPAIQQVLLFDPTIDALPQMHERFRFSKYGIGKNYKGPDVYGTRNFLKVDVEGHEWKAMKDMHWAVLNGFSQMVIEFHFLHVLPLTGLSPYFSMLYEEWANEMNLDCFSLYERVLRRINAFFYCFHAHVNNSLPLMNLNGYSFPPLLEMSFIRKDMVKDVRLSEETFPVPGLDSPNKTDSPDPASAGRATRHWSTRFSTARSRASSIARSTSLAPTIASRASSSSTR